jgi:hypothetical protein
VAELGPHRGTRRPPAPSSCSVHQLCPASPLSLGLCPTGRYTYCQPGSPPTTSAAPAPQNLGLASSALLCSPATRKWIRQLIYLLILTVSYSGVFFIYPSMLHTNMHTYRNMKCMHICIKSTDYYLLKNIFIIKNNIILNYT